MNRLSVRYDHAPDDIGWLQLEVETPNFSGRGGNWAYASILDEFARSLDEYPLGSPRRLELDHNDSRGDDKLMSVEVRPIGSRGELMVHVEIADYLEPMKRVRTQFLTHYPALERFQRAVRLVAAGDAAEAVLTGE